MAGDRNELSTHDAPTVVFNVLVVDDDPVVRHALGSLLEADPNLTVIDAVATAESALDVLRDRDVDLVVLDDVLAGELTGQEAAPLMRRIDPALKIVLFSIKAEAGQESESIDSFVSKSHLDLLLPTVRLVLGLSWANVATPQDEVVNLVTERQLAL